MRSSAIVELSAAGNAEAFREFVLEYGPVVWAVAIQMTQNEADMQDAAQETFFRAWLEIPRFRGECAIQRWLARIAVHCADDLVRERERQAYPRLAPGVDIASEDPSQERSVFWSEMQKAFIREVRGLANRERMAFVLRHIEGVDTASIARVMGVSEVAARNSIFRAMKKVRAAMKEQMGWNLCT